MRAAIQSDVTPFVDESVDGVLVTFLDRSLQFFDFGLVGGGKRGMKSMNLNGRAHQ